MWMMTFVMRRQSTLYNRDERTVLPI